MELDGEEWDENRGIQTSCKVSLLKGQHPIQVPGVKFLQVAVCLETTYQSRLLTPLLRFLRRFYRDGRHNFRLSLSYLQQITPYKVRSTLNNQ